MRIKEEFKKLGYFWRPSEPDKRLPGTLSISDGGNIELEVLHQLGYMSPPFSDVRFGGFDGGGKRIVGVIENNDIVNNKMVTLENCYYKSLGSGSLATSLIHADTVFIGVASYDEDDTPLFKSLTFSVEGIDEWIRISGIEFNLQHEEHTPTISYHWPETIPLNLGDGMQLLITFRLRTRITRIKEAGISQKTYFTLTSQEARKLDDFISVVRKITHFLYFAMDQVVSLDGMSAAVDNLHQDLGRDPAGPVQVDIYYPSWPYSKDEPEIQQPRMLFGFEQIQNDAETRIKNWMDIYEQIEPALDLYFLAKMGAQPTSKAQFLALAQSLEACHRRTNGGQEHFGKRLENIIEPFEEIIGDQTIQKKLISRIVNTRNYLTHYDQRLESKAAKDEELSPLCLKMELLFQLHFLQLIGLSREDIEAIIPKLRWKLQ